MQNFFLIKSYKYPFYLILLVVPSLISGPFLPDLIISTIGLIYIYLCVTNNRLYFYKKNIYIFYISFLLYLIIILFNSSYLQLSISSSLFYFRFILFSLGLALILSKNYEFFKKFLLINLIVILFVSSDLIFQYFFKKNLFGMEIVDINNRLSGLFGDELIAGSFLSRLFFLGLIFFLIAFNFKRNYQKILFIIYLILVTSAIFFTGERTAFFIVCFNIFLTFFSVKKFRKFILYSIILIIFLFGFLNIVYPHFGKRMFQGTKEQVLGTKRIIIFSEHYESHYKISLKMFKDKPIFGHGVKSFREVCKNPKYHVDNGCATHPHNFYVQLLAETGLVGCFFLFFFYFYIIKMFLNYFFKKDKNNFDYIKLILCQVIIVNFWPIQPSGNFFNNWLNIVLYIPIGLLILFESNNLKYSFLFKRKI
jgi:O-antigen ligase